MNTIERSALQQGGMADGTVIERVLGGEKELYEILESATDLCESVANIIESIVLKHN